MTKNFSRLFALAAGVMLLGACATTPKIDWGSRIGSYTFDNAVRELGPPDKDANLTDGSRVSEWLTGRGRGGGVFVGGGYGYRRFGPMYHMVDPGPDYYLRLSFDTNGTLIDWKKYAK